MRQRVAWISLYGLLEANNAPLQLYLGAARQVEAAHQISLICLSVLRVCFRESTFLIDGQMQSQFFRNVSRNLILHVEHIAQIAIIDNVPNLCSFLYIDEFDMQFDAVVVFE